MTKGYRVPPEHVATRGFHGTDYDFGDAVLPRSKHGNVHFDFSGKNDTYFLPAQPHLETEAWAWASGESRFRGENPRSRHRVHITEPEPEQHIDANLHGKYEPTSDRAWRENARVTPSQRIIDTHWAPPPRVWGHSEYSAGDPHDEFSESHVESTLPHVNWRQFGGENYKVFANSGQIRADGGQVLRESSMVPHGNSLRGAREFAGVDYGRSRAEQLPGQMSFGDVAKKAGASGWRRNGVAPGGEHYQSSRRVETMGGRHYLIHNPGVNGVNRIEKVYTS